MASEWVIVGSLSLILSSRYCTPEVLKSLRNSLFWCLSICLSSVLVGGFSVISMAVYGILWASRNLRAFRQVLHLGYW